MLFILTVMILIKQLKGFTNNHVLTELQGLYKASIQNTQLPIVLCTGPAGTGKTMIACHEAIASFKARKINKIIITRPTVTVEENIGFLPGTVEDKLYPFMVPIYDYFLEYYTKEQITTLINNGRLEIAPLAYMRGRTFSNSFLIADEMQNSSKNQFKMLLTRLGENSKMVITGDLQQNDLGPNNGLQDFLDVLNKKYKTKLTKNKNGFEHIKFDKSGIKRSHIISKIIDLYEEDL